MLSHDEVLDVLEDSWNCFDDELPTWGDVLPCATMGYLVDIKFRDRLIIRWINHGADFLRLGTTLIDVPEEWDETRTLRAIAYWTLGDSTAAVQSALPAAENGYSLAILVIAAIGAGLPAEEWARVMRENVTEEDCR